MLYVSYLVIHSLLGRLSLCATSPSSYARSFLVCFATGSLPLIAAVRTPAAPDLRRFACFGSGRLRAQPFYLSGCAGLVANPILRSYRTDLRPCLAACLPHDLTRMLVGGGCALYSLVPRSYSRAPHHFAARLPSASCAA